MWPAQRLTKMRGLNVVSSRIYIFFFNLMLKGPLQKMLRTCAVCAQSSDMKTTNGLVLLQGLHCTGCGIKKIYSILSAWDFTFVTSSVYAKYRIK